jgi:hypothetical protein
MARATIAGDPAGRAAMKRAVVSKTGRAGKPIDLPPFDPEAAARFLAGIRAGLSKARTAESAGVPLATVNAWLRATNVTSGAAFRRALRLMGQGRYRELQAFWMDYVQATMESARARLWPAGVVGSRSGAREQT